MNTYSDYSNSNGTYLFYNTSTSNTLEVRGFKYYTNSNGYDISKYSKVKHEKEDEFIKEEEFLI